jgi:zinc transport system substrate-binding protein
LNKDRKMIRVIFAFCLFPGALLAEAPRVMTDIAPIHSLTAQVMGDVGAPELLLPPGADPHDFALRPSDAGRLAEADLVIWVGEGLTPWLEEPIATLAPEAARMSLLDAAGWAKREINDHGHDHGHDHGEADPHAWLDPEVAQVWVAAIAEELAALDPENAEVYRGNAAVAQLRLQGLTAELAAQLAPFAARSYVLPHDGYQYFEARFGLEATSSIAGIDARTPGPAQVSALRDMMAQEGIVCVFADAEIGDNWATLVIEGTDAKTAMIDGVGAGLSAGPDLYDALLIRLAGAFADCLK